MIEKADFWPKLTHQGWTGSNDGCSVSSHFSTMHRSVSSLKTDKHARTGKRQSPEASFHNTTGFDLTCFVLPHSHIPNHQCFRSPLLSPPPCSLYPRTSHHIGKRCLPLCLYLPRRTLTYPSMRPTTFNAALPSAYLVRLASDLKARFSDVLQHMRRWGTEGTVSSSGRGVGTCKVQARLYMLQDCTCIIRALDANIGIIGEMHDLSISLSLFVMDISRHFLHLQYIRYWPEAELCGSQLLTSYSRCVSFIVFMRFSTAYFVLQ